MLGSAAHINLVGMLAKTTAHQDIPRQATGQGIGQDTTRSSGQGSAGYSVRHRAVQRQLLAVEPNAELLENVQCMMHLEIIVKSCAAVCQGQSTATSNSLHNVHIPGEAAKEMQVEA